MTATPYPDLERLRAALADGACLPCHLCADGERSECGACLGSGFLRPCGRCFTSGSVIDRQTGAPRGCLVCDTHGYTAGEAPSACDVGAGRFVLSFRLDAGRGDCHHAVRNALRKGHI